MDSRLVEYRFGSGAFHEADRGATRRAVAVVRLGAPAEEIEEALASVRRFRFSALVAEARERFQEEIKRALRRLFVSAPLRAMPLRAPRIVPVLALSEGVGLTHAPHAPPAGLLAPRHDLTGTA